jgi:hypothetical protein
MNVSSTIRRAMATLLLSSVARASELPGPASGTTELRYSTIEIAMSPPAPLSGQRARLTVLLKPKPGLEWRQPRLVPWTARVVPPEGWSADPAEPAFEAAGPSGAWQEIATTLTRGGRTSKAALLLELTCALGGTSGEFFDKLLIEKSRITVAMPNAGITAEAATELAPVLGIEFPEEPGADTTDDARDGASPIMPAVFFALATCLVMTGIAVSMRHSRQSG